MAYRLIDHADGIEDPRRRALVQVYAESTPLLRVLPIMPAPNGVYKVEREVSMPSVGFRRFNEGFSESTGTTEELFEPCRTLGGDIDIDILMEEMNPGRRTTEESKGVKNLAHHFDYYFIKGDRQSNSKEIDGLQARAGTTGVNVHDVDGALSLAELDEWIDNTREPTHLMMTRKMRNKLTAASRLPSVSGNINFVTDEFGKQVMTYNDLPILIADPVGKNKLAIDNSETNDTSGDPTTSIYVLSLGEGEGVFGIQMQPPRLRDLNELDDKPSLRTRIEWHVGLVVTTPDSFTRLRRIDPASAITA